MDKFTSLLAFLLVIFLLLMGSAWVITGLMHAYTVVTLLGLGTLFVASYIHNNFVRR